MGGDKVQTKAEKNRNGVRDGVEDEEVKEKFDEIDFFQKCTSCTPEYSENDGRSTTTQESSFRHLSLRVYTCKLNCIIYHIIYVIYVRARGVAGVDGQPLKRAYWTAIENVFTDFYEHACVGKGFTVGFKTHFASIRASKCSVVVRALGTPKCVPKCETRTFNNYNSGRLRPFDRLRVRVTT